MLAWPVTEICRAPSDPMTAGARAANTTDFGPASAGPTAPPLPSPDSALPSAFRPAGPRTLGFAPADSGQLSATTDADVRAARPTAT